VTRPEAKRRQGPFQEVPVSVDSLAAASPRVTARMAGLCYLLMMVSGGLATLARRGLLVGGDAEATATNIMAHQARYQLSFGAELWVVAFYVGVVALFHQLLKPVNGNVSLLAAFFGLLGCAVQGSAAVFQLAPLAALAPAQYLSVFTANQLHAEAYLFLTLYGQAYGVALVFFGFYCFLIGCLVFKSTFLPRYVGVMMAVAGLAWLTFLFPAFATKYFSWILPFAVGEGVITLWLLVKGVDAVRWSEQVNVARERRT
jgi:Domain of unknown function (DUF4386)